MTSTCGLAAYWNHPILMHWLGRRLPISLAISLPNSVRAITTSTSTARTSILVTSVRNNCMRLRSHRWRASSAIMQMVFSRNRHMCYCAQTFLGKITCKSSISKLYSSLYERLITIQHPLLFIETRQHLAAMLQPSPFWTTQRGPKYKKH